MLDRRPESLEEERYRVCVRRTDRSAFRHFFGKVSHLREISSNNARLALRSTLAQVRTFVEKKG
jgi:hypothetical protein